MNQITLTTGEVVTFDPAKGKYWTDMKPKSTETVPTQWQSHTFRLGETVETGTGKKAVITEALGRSVKIRFADGHAECRFVEQIEKLEATK